MNRKLTVVVMGATSQQGGAVVRELLARVADAFVYIGATVFTASFLNYARTELDL